MVCSDPFEKVMSEDKADAVELAEVSSAPFGPDRRLFFPLTLAFLMDPSTYTTHNN